MKLKNFLLDLASNNQQVEIYFTQKYGDPTFGFRINNIDSSGFAEVKNLAIDHTLIIDEIKNCFFSNSTLIDENEGETTYLLLPNGGCIKSAEYFDSISDSAQIWIENNETEFNLGTIAFTFDQILITKDFNTFIINEEKEIKQVLPTELFENFVSFYKELLSQFQKMQTLLQIDYDEQNHATCKILNMKGSYKENMNFTLLDACVIDYPDEELKSLLITYFNIESKIANKMFAI